MIQLSPVALNLLGFKINTMDNSAVVNVGSMQTIDLFLAYKRNQAIAEVNGDFSPINLPFNSIVDTDIIDNPSVKNSVV